MSDFEESINIMVYADSGVGKTVLAGGCDLILGVEKGLISAKRMGSKAKLWPIREWQDLRNAYAYLKASTDEGSCPYKWVAMDSGTEMQQMALRWILEEAKKIKKERDLDIPEIQDHQKWQNMFKRFIKMFNDLDVNMLYTALPLHTENEEGDPIVLPEFQGKGFQIAQWVCAQMSAVGYMKVIKVRVKGTSGDPDDKGTIRETRVISWVNDGTIFAKDRYNVLGKQFLDPTLRKIHQKIMAPPPPANAYGPVAAPGKRPAGKAGKPVASVSGPATATPVAAAPAGLVPDTIENRQLGGPEQETAATPAAEVKGPSSPGVDESETLVDDDDEENS